MHALMDFRYFHLRNISFNYNLYPFTTNRSLKYEDSKIFNVNYSYCKAK